MRGIIEAAGVSLGIALAARGALLENRIFGAQAIDRHITQARKGIDWATRGRTSIADRPHRHLREIARRTTRPGTAERRAAYEAARRG